MAVNSQARSELRPGADPRIEPPRALIAYSPWAAIIHGKRFEEHV